MATYWKVQMAVFAFETEAQAKAFNNALIDAFCAMPESEGYGSSHQVIGVEESATPPVRAEGEE